ncbi:MAG: hypothetical protein ABSE70_00345 [Candidatus Limnocylindrales bacterium]
MNHPRLYRRFAVVAIAALVLGLIPMAVAVAAADRLVITGPGAVTNGFSHSYTVTAMDGASVDTAYTGTVTLSVNGGTTTLPKSHTFVGGDAGVYAFTGVQLETGDRTLTASDGSIADGTLVVTARDAGLATRLVWTAPASAHVGAATSVTITGQDDYASLDTTYTGTIHFSSTDISASLPGDYPFTTGSGQDNGTHTFTNGVTFETVGTWTLTATDTVTSGITGTTGDISVKLAQTITFAALADKRTDQMPITVSATASSGLDVSFTSATPLVCAESGTNGTTITLVAAGTCTINADQAGDSTYDQAPRVTRSFAINTALTQTISFGPLADKTADDAPFAVSATASSGLDVTFTSATTGVCTVSGTNGTTVTLHTLGTCTINANQAGDSTYDPADQVPQSFNIFNITPATAAKLVITGSGSQTAGASQNLTITAKDASGNTATGYVGAKDLTFSGAGSIGAYNPTVRSSTGSVVAFGTATTITFSAGVATVSGGDNGVMTLYLAETAVISATEGSIGSTGADRLTVIVGHAGASQLVFTASPASSTAGAPFGTQPVVTIEDLYGNVVTSDLSSVTLSITAGTPTSGGPGTLSGAAAWQRSAASRSTSSARPTSSMRSTAPSRSPTARPSTSPRLASTTSSSALATPPSPPTWAPRPTRPRATTSTTTP